EDTAFRDQKDLEAGEWPHNLKERIRHAEVVVVLIGEHWKEIIRNRINDPEDWVRLEIDLAIQQRKLLVPVYLDGRHRVTKTAFPDDNSGLPLAWQPVLLGCEDVELSEADLDADRQGKAKLLRLLH